MNHKKRNIKKAKFEKRMKMALVLVAGIYVLVTLSLNSIESSLNIKVQRVEEEVEVMKGQRDGLNTTREEKISFDNIVTVAKKQGYTLNYALNQASAKNE